MRITREYVLQTAACPRWQDPGFVAKHVPEGGLSAYELTDRRRFKAATVEDRLWLLLREEFFSESELRLLACKWARRALRLDPSPDPRSVQAVGVAERFGSNGNATEEELAAAEAAAWAAAGAAAWAAAEAAAGDARAAAGAAAGAAAWAAAGAAAGDAWAAAEAAAGDAARKQQLADLRKALR